MSTIAGWWLSSGWPEHVAHGLVEDDRHELALLAGGGGIHFDPRIRRNAHAERVQHLAVHLDPAVLDPLVGLAARAKPELGHAFRKAWIVLRVHGSFSFGLTQITPCHQAR
jgi:hypothetical protein